MFLAVSSYRAYLGLAHARRKYWNIVLGDLQLSKYWSNIRQVLTLRRTLADTATERALSSLDAASSHRKRKSIARYLLVYGFISLVPHLDRQIPYALRVQKAALEQGK